MTLTGADDAVRPEELAGLSGDFPFVEWGVLASKGRVKPQFPSARWIERVQEFRGVAERMSLHLCEGWVRELCEPSPRLTYPDRYPELWGMFRRLQINFGTRFQVREESSLVALLQRWTAGKEVIIQVHRRSSERLVGVCRRSQIQAVPLYDASGGRGVAPPRWPPPMPGLTCGYAGGLGPETMEAEVRRLAEAVGDSRVWIDMQTHVRTDGRFDIAKARRCLEIGQRLGAGSGRGV